MTSPPPQITFECPDCGERYEDWFRASLNLGIEHFSEEYIREATTATCPSCGHVVELDSLVIERDVWRWR
jgi:large subunit ribosomal protein L7/L12